MNRRDAWKGMNWIRPEKRMAIYLRDDLRCVYCGATLGEVEHLTLDHLKAHSKGGDNAATNLVTACAKCNSSRGNRPVETFVKAVAQYINHGADAVAIMRHIRNTSRRSLKPHLAQAKAMKAEGRKIWGSN